MAPNNSQKSAFTHTFGDALSTAVVALDMTLTITQMNAAAENLFGKSRNRAVDKPFSFLFKDRGIKQHLGFVIKHKEPKTLRECHLQGAHYENVLVDCVANPIFNIGELTGIVLELHRVDHQSRLSKEEQLLNQQEATQMLVRGMAHEIKNPLGGIRGAAQLLESELEAINNSGLKDYTNIIISEADRLKKLVDRMLGSPQPIKNEAINIHEVLERVRKIILADLPKEVELRFDYDPSIPDLNGDRDSLIQLVFNIAGNAIKAVGDSGNILFKTRVLRNFTINQQMHRLTLRLDIIDNGQGVPDEIRDKLFFPMISGSAKGTGLGLSIAQSLANRHHGIIEFESQPSKTCFTLLLPITSLPNNDNKQEQPYA